MFNGSMVDIAVSDELMSFKMAEEISHNLALFQVLKTASWRWYNDRCDKNFRASSINYCDVIWTLKPAIPLAEPLFVQGHIQSSNKETVKAQQYFIFMLGIHR